MLLDIDPKNDYVFKRIFGVPAHTPILIHLLNAVLNPPIGRLVTDLEIRNPFNEKEFEDDKLTVVDIKAEDQEGRVFNIEMQILISASFTRRILYYWSKLFQQQIVEGDEYSQLQPTYSICFVNDLLFQDSKSHHSLFRLRDEESKLIFADDLAIHLIELPKFLYSERELRSELDKWCYFLRHAASLERGFVPDALDDPPIRQALEVLNVMTQDQVERERYEARLKKQRDWRMFVNDARRQGHEEGLERGLERGLEKGTKLGQIDRVHALERLLKRSESDSEALLAMSVEALVALAQKLEGELASVYAKPAVQ